MCCSKLLCLILNLRAISEYKLPGAYIWRGDLSEGFYITSLGGLIFRGAYFLNFMVTNQANYCGLNTFASITHYLSLKLLLLSLLLLFKNVIFHSMLELSNMFFYMYMFYS